MKKNIDVTVAIVNYNTSAALEICLKSFFRFAKGIAHEVYVVDNHSRDNSAEMVRKKFPQVKLILNKSNRFATIANNQIFHKARGKYLLILNPDVEFTQNAILKMKLFLDTHNQVGLVSCRMILSNGRTDETCTRFITAMDKFFSDCILAKLLKLRKINSNSKYPGWDRTSTKPVEAISDIILLARKSVLSQIGLYDEHLKLFFMEDDLSIRVHRIGFTAWHIGEVSVSHLKGEATKQFLPRQMYEIFEADLFYYTRKHFGFFWYLFIWLTFQSNRLYYLFNP